MIYQVEQCAVLETHTNPIAAAFIQNKLQRLIWILGSGATAMPAISRRKHGNSAKDGSPGQVPSLSTEIVIAAARENVGTSVAANFYDTRN